MDTTVENTCDNCQYEEEPIDEGVCATCRPVYGETDTLTTLWSNFVTPSTFAKKEATARRNSGMSPTSSLDKQEGGGHYKTLAIQPIQYIHANGLGFIEGCIVKYATRWRAKGGVGDLKKIIHFAELLIELESEITND